MKRQKVVVVGSGRATTQLLAHTTFFGCILWPNFVTSVFVKRFPIDLARFEAKWTIFDSSSSKTREFEANYNVKLSTSKMQNQPGLVRSHKPPNQVVRMLVLSMKNNTQAFLCFWRCLEFCSDPCACLGVTKVVPGILPVHWDIIGAIWFVTAIL